MIPFKRVFRRSVLLLAASMSTFVNASIPNWVLNPVADKGIASVSCVKFSGNLSSDAKLASANVRLALSQQIETRVEGIDEVYESRHSTNDATTITTTFSSASKQATKQLLKGVNVKQTELVDIAGQSYLCSLATLEPSETKAFFDDLIQQSKRKLTDLEQQQLYDEFTAKEDKTAEQTLTEAINHQ